MSLNVSSGLLPTILENVRVAKMYHTRIVSYKGMTKQLQDIDTMKHWHCEYSQPVTLNNLSLFRCSEK